MTLHYTTQITLVTLHYTTQQLQLQLPLQQLLQLQLHCITLHNNKLYKLYTTLHNYNCNYNHATLHYTTLH